MLLRLFSPKSPFSGRRLEGERVFLRPPRRSEWREWTVLRQKNAQAHGPFSPEASFRGLTKRGYLERIASYEAGRREGSAYVFSIFLKETGALAGGLTINNIVRGAGQMATLGYWLDEDMRGQGLMAEAVRLACGFAFHELGLHRVQAGCLADNRPSRRVLEKCGFVEEGIARKYLRIAGMWQDHVIYALLAEDFN